MYHVPVLLAEVLAGLEVQSDDQVLDLTLGGGGYARAILDRLGPRGRLIGVDQDEEAIQEASRQLGNRPNFLAVKGNFRNLDELLGQLGVGAVQKAVMDLGVSSRQLDRPERGFSFRHDAPLDMRMDPSRGSTAAGWLARVEGQELERALRVYGEEKFSSRIARAVLKERGQRPIETTGQLAGVIERAVPAAARHGRIHPATRSFQAIRIVINDELGALEAGLEQALQRLSPGGRMAVVAYHSLEDRLVKQMLRRYSGVCVCPREFPLCRCQPERWLRAVNRRVIQASDEEVAANPRARSARLRVVERLTD